MQSVPQMDIKSKSKDMQDAMKNLENLAKKMGGEITISCGNQKVTLNPQPKVGRGGTVGKDARSADPDDIVQHPERFYQV
jgi:hypothetical protein